MSIVYLIKPVGHNVYKIGETIDLTARLERIQKRFDERLVVVQSASVPAHLRTRIEGELHRIYLKSRIGNDWFILSEREVNGFLSMVRAIERELSE